MYKIILNIFLVDLAMSQVHSYFTIIKIYLPIFIYIKDDRAKIWWLILHAYPRNAKYYIIRNNNYPLFEQRKQIEVINKTYTFKDSIQRGKSINPRPIRVQRSGAASSNWYHPTYTTQSHEICFGIKAVRVLLPFFHQASIKLDSRAKYRDTNK